MGNLRGSVTLEAMGDRVFEFQFRGETLVAIPLSGVPVRGVTLTEAEREVVEFVLKGLSTAEIASLRGVSDSTVSNQLSGLYRKLGVGSRGELAASLSTEVAGREA